MLIISGGIEVKQCAKNDAKFWDDHGAILVELVYDVRKKYVHSATFSRQTVYPHSASLIRYTYLFLLTLHSCCS